MIPPRRRRTRWRVDSCYIVSNQSSRIKKDDRGRVASVPTHLLDVVVRKGAAILELLSGEDQALLVGGDALLVLDLGLDIVDGVGRLHLKGDSLTRQGLHETDPAVSNLGSITSSISAARGRRSRGKWDGGLTSALIKRSASQCDSKKAC